MPLPDKHGQLGRIKSHFHYYLELKKDTPLPEYNTGMTSPSLWTGRIGRF